MVYLSRMARLRLLLYSGLVLAVLVSTQGLLMTQAAFTLRRDYIAERLCVNRDRPEENCHGRCYLTAKAKQERERQQERQTLLLEVALAVTLLRPESPTLPVVPVRDASAWAVASEDAPPGGALPGIFHPPRVG